MKLTKIITSVLFSVLALVIVLGVFANIPETQAQQFLQSDPFWKPLTLSGTTTAIITGTYTETQVISLVPAAGEVYVVTGLNVEIEDSTVISSGYYGGITLTNGITLRKTDETGTLIDFTNGITISEGQHWGRFCEVTVSVGNDNLRADCEFPGYLRLNGDREERLEVVIDADDYSGLDGHWFIAKGFVE